MTCQHDYAPVEYVTRIDKTKPNYTGDWCCRKCYRFKEKMLNIACWDKEKRTWLPVSEMVLGTTYLCYASEGEFDPKGPRDTDSYMGKIRKVEGAEVNLPQPLPRSWIPRR